MIILNRREMGDGVSRIMEDIISRVTQSQRQLLRYRCSRISTDYGDDTISYYLPTFENLTERRRTGQTIHIVKILCPSRVDGRWSTPTADVDDGRRR